MTGAAKKVSIRLAGWRSIGRIGLAATLFCVAAYSRGEIIAGRVVGITDGDTVKVLTPSPENREIKVRLAGIDAPERGQPFGKASKQALSDLVFGQNVTLDGDKIDRYGRLVAKIQYEGRDINLEIVRLGLAWWYRKYADEQTAADQKLYEAAEADARGRRVGLWADAEPVPPWDWRRK
jgi:micrococcal nuclease